jgi:predicted MFS family arabinose efflux permease
VPLLGYGAGLLLIVPIADLVENRRLALVLMGAEAAALLALTVLGWPAPFLAAAFIVGLCATSVQVLVPYPTYLLPERLRGEAVGRIVSGVMLGIMLARPLSSFIADQWGWRAIFAVSALATILMAGTIARAMPSRRPAPGLSYRALLLSMGRLFLRTEALRRRGLYKACMFGAFSTFWTAVQLWMTGSAFRLSQSQLAGVALAGVAGAVAPPLAGRLSDRGFGRLGTAVAMFLAVGAFLLTSLAPRHSSWGVALIVGCAVVLDLAVSANLVFGQRVIFGLPADLRSRLNGLYIGMFFMGGAAGSALSGWCYVRFGWPGIVALGALLPLLGMGYFLTERGVRASIRGPAAERKGG